MRRSLFAVLLLLGLGFGGRAQSSRARVPALSLPTDSASGKILYEAVVQQPGASQAELYRRARNWFISTFKDYPHVVATDDQAGGEVAGTYCTIMQKITNSYEVWRTLRVYVREGRDIGNAYDPQIYRIEPTNPMNVRRYGPEVARQAEHDIASLVAAMALPTGIGKAW